MASHWQQQSQHLEQRPTNSFLQPNNNFQQPIGQFQYPVEDLQQPFDDFQQPLNHLQHSVDHWQQQPEYSQQPPINYFLHPADDLQQPLDHLRQPIDLWQRRIDYFQRGVHAVVKEVANRDGSEMKRKKILEVYESAGGWEGWFQIEMLIALRDRLPSLWPDFDVVVEREGFTYLTTPSQSEDEVENAKKRADLVIILTHVETNQLWLIGIELKCESLKNIEAFITEARKDRKKVWNTAVDNTECSIIQFNIIAHVNATKLDAFLEEDPDVVWQKFLTVEGDVQKVYNEDIEDEEDKERGPGKMTFWSAGRLTRSADH